MHCKLSKGDANTVFSRFNARIIRLDRAFINKDISLLFCLFFLVYIPFSLVTNIQSLMNYKSLAKKEQTNIREDLVLARRQSAFREIFFLLVDGTDRPSPLLIDSLL